MDKLVLATKNKGKIAELETLLSPLGIKLISAHDVQLRDVDETGTTFTENAILKAEAIAAFTGLPALADDSGLCVDALGGEPGVYTARFGDYNKLLDTMKEVAPEARGAHFTCVIAFALPEGATETFEGQSNGAIALAAIGEQGFGFDPVFVPQGDTRTYAQMSSNEKAQTSHRAKALNKFIKYLEQRIAA